MPIFSRIETLDGLRGLAALIVVISHFSNATGFLGGALGHGAGQIGVMLFFVLSGFLMGHLYLDQEPTRQNMARFARNRIARVAPLYVLVVLASVLLGSAGGQTWPLYSVNIGNLAQHLLFLKGQDILWTIPVEMQFYALFLLIWAQAARSRSTLIISFLLYGALLSLAGYPKEPLLLRSLPFFLAGIVLSLLQRIEPGRSASIGWVACMFVLPLGFPQITGPLKFHLGLSPVPTEFPRVWELPAYLALLPMLLWLSLKAPAAEIVFGSRFARHMGEISYSLYLLHMPVMLLLGIVPALRDSTFVYGCVFLIVTVSVASLSRKWVEQPLERLIRSRLTP